MNAGLGWALAVAAIALGYMSYGWPGVALAFSVIVFWLLLQFSRSLRVLRLAARSPVGQVAGAVMFNARLREGLRLPEVIGMTKSLGRKLREEPLETYEWVDAGGVAVEVEFEGGRCKRWTLRRPEEPDRQAPDS
jgi:uncharacterized protein (DUF58 family)